MTSMIGATTRRNRNRFVGRGRPHGGTRRLGRWLAALLTVALTLLGVSLPALAANGVPTLTKELDTTQGRGFTAPNTFQTGATVAYRMTATCSSNTTDCTIGTITDVLDPRLQFSSVRAPVQTTPSIPFTSSVSGQTVTITIGDGTTAWPDGNSLEFWIYAVVRDSASGTIPNRSTITTTDVTTPISSQTVDIVVPEPAPKWYANKDMYQPTGGSIVAGENASFKMELRTPIQYGNVGIAAGWSMVDTFPAGAVPLDPTTLKPVPNGGTVASGGKVDLVNHTVTWSNLPAVSAANLFCYSTYCTVQGVDQFLILNFPAAVFANAAPATNTVDLNVTYTNGATAKLTDTATVAFTAQTQSINLGKSGPANLVAGQPLQWRLFSVNNGNFTLTDLTVQDIFPTTPGLTGWEIVRNYAGYNPVTPANAGPVTFQYRDAAGAWQDWFVHNTGDTWATKALPAGATGFRMTDAAQGPLEMLDIYLRAQTDPAMPIGTSITNCDSVTASNQLSNVPNRCVTTTIVAPFSTFETTKFHRYDSANQADVAPGESYTYGLVFSINDGIIPSTVDVIDVLPKGVVYETTYCYKKYYNPSDPRSGFNNLTDPNTGAVPGVSCTIDGISLPLVQPTVTPNADGTTTLHWKDLPLPADYKGWENLNLILRVHAEPGTAVGSYTNTVLVTTNQHATRCVPDFGVKTVTDTTDLDGDGSTTDILCGNADIITVREAAVANVYKWDKGNLGRNVLETTGQSSTICPDWDGYTRYPCVATLSPSGSFDYRLKIINSGNIELTDGVVYDILPHLGDVGVNQALANSQRGTVWTPTMTGPVTLDPAYPAAAGLNFTVEYNLSYDPCRPEMSAPTPGVTWQAGCDNTWLTASQITDWSTVKSFRVKVNPDGAAWKPAQSLVVRLPMVAPPNAPDSISDDPATPANELKLSAAWNSVGLQYYRLNGDGSTTAMPAAAPRKVGVIVPFPGVSIGDYVWLDVNRDGLQGDPAVETPIKDVTVTLKDAAGAVVGTTTTDANGYFFFQYVKPNAKYTVTFTAPTGMTYTIQDAGADTSNSPTADLTDSDADPTTGVIAFTTPADGNNLADPTKTDNPGLDAGFVTQLNLSLKKTVTSSGPYRAGSTVTFALTPHNDGPMDALTGWSVTDILPTGLTLTGMSGTGYACDKATATCVANAGLPAGTDGGVITVTATVQAGVQAGDVKNVAYVAPAKGEVTETNPLVVPTSTTDTTTTPTDNDAQAAITVANPVSIGDYVWWDVNRDGQQGAPSDEPAVAGMTVNLYAADGATLIAATQTDANGYYAFTGLAAGTAYVVEFVKPAGARFTSGDTGADATDSDADVSTGRVTVTTPASGDNLATPGKADDPTIDAGLVKYNLTLAKTLDTKAPFVPGQTVTFTLTPKNEGPTDARYGYSVQEILPAGLTLVGMSGTGYTCNGVICTHAAPLAAGATGTPITVTATIDAGVTGTLHNVAYISPWDDATDATPTDDPETNPLVVPTQTTDTAATATDNDAQADLSVTPVSIGDYVWWDVNRNGQQDAGEAPIAGVTVNLYAADGVTKVATASTDANGYYAFANLSPATKYVVEFVAPAGAFSTLRDTGPDGTDSDPDAMGRVTVTTKSSGANLSDPTKADDPTIDAGFVKVNLVLAKKLTSTGQVFAGTTVTFTLTPSNNGSTDALAGWSVTDLLPTGLTLETISGTGYTCDKATATCVAAAPLGAGATGNDITVTAKVAAGFNGQQKNVAYVSPAPSEVPETNPLVVPTGTTDTTTSPTDNDAEAPLTVDSLVSLGDYVWLDTNRNGVQEATEPPVPGVVVTLYAADGTTVVKTATTDSTGFYAFVDLTPGATYVVQFTKPTAYAFTSANAGGDDTRDSDADVTTGKVTVVARSSGGNSATTPDDPTVDAGLVQVNLTLAKSLQPGGPYYPGSTVTFVLTPHNDGPADALTGWSVTDILPAGLTIVGMTGTGYTCTGMTCVAQAGLASGTDGAPITVTATVDKAFVGELHNVAYVSPAANEIAETNILVVPSTGTDTAATPTDNDAQAKVTVDSLVSVGDYVWIDVNRDGKQGDPAVENPVAGVTVTLRDATGAIVGTTTTDAKGFYSFVDLVPGNDYTLTFTRPAGYSWTKPTAGFDWRIDSDVNPTTGVVAFKAPASGVNSATTPDDPTLDGGLVKLNLVLAKSLTSKGPFYAGSSVSFALTPHNEGPAGALAGWSVTEILPAGLTLVSMSGSGYACSGATCVADAGLAAGADGPVITVTATVDKAFVGALHNVAYVSPDPTEIPETNPLVVPTTDTDTAASATDNDAQASLTVDSLVSVGDYIWLDVNRDGQQGDPAVEKPVAGVVVKLYAADGATLLATTTTDAKGFYSFVDLVPGREYVIEFVKPDGTAFTSKDTGPDGTDSDADPQNGRVTFTAPATGTNSATAPDKPTIDAGLVDYDLLVKKALTTTGAIHPGDVITYTIVAHNAGPADVLPGWTVTDQLPKQLTLVSIKGDGFTCVGSTCTNAKALRAGADSTVITVLAKVSVGVSGEFENVAVVQPSNHDTPERNPNNNTDKTPAKVTPTDKKPLPVTGESTSGTLQLAAGLILLGGLALIVARPLRGKGKVK